ncbi:phospholipase [Streptosporangium fragile]|uniref:Phospholipase n=1 Tax=Streptosporangium fragile TaxID=46186 RepID=A0ABP6IQ97_9ACTN
MNQPRFIRKAITAATTAVLSLGLLAGTGTSAEAQGRSLRATADHLMNLNAADFVRQPHVAPFDWGNNGCNAMPGPQARRFHIACVQHDFGYRNYGGRSHLKLGPDEETRRWIDERFWHEMRRICIDQHASSGWCLTEAATSYRVVRAAGRYLY